MGQKPVKNDWTINNYVLNCHSNIQWSLPMKALEVWQEGHKKEKIWNK